MEHEKKFQQLAVSVLTNNLQMKNQTYIRIFTQNPIYQEPLFLGAQMPTNFWVNNMKEYMSINQSIELYNHFILWLKIINTNSPMLILYNDTQPTQNDNTWSFLIYNIINEFTSFGNSDKDQFDLFLLGKYLDNCFTFKHIKKIHTEDNEFDVYKTTDVNGTYGYICTPEGAKKIINFLYKNPCNVNTLFHKLITDKHLVTLEYHPSIIISSLNHETRFEAKSIRSNTYLWLFIMFLIVGLILFGFFWIAFVNMRCHTFRKDLSSPNNSKDEIGKNIIICCESFQDNHDIIPYGPYKNQSLD